MNDIGALLVDIYLCVCVRVCVCIQRNIQLCLKHMAGFEIPLTLSPMRAADKRSLAVLPPRKYASPCKVSHKMNLVWEGSSKLLSCCPRNEFRTRSSWPVDLERFPFSNNRSEFSSWNSSGILLLSLHLSISPTSAIADTKSCFRISEMRSMASKAWARRPESISSDNWTTRSSSSSKYCLRRRRESWADRRLRSNRLCFLEPATLERCF